MCVPLGHRNHRSSSGGNVITKEQVERIITAGDFQCFSRSKRGKEFAPYESSADELLQILHDCDTTIRLADRRNKLYSYSLRTIIMKAPCISATVAIQTK